MTVVEMLEKKRNQDREWDDLAAEMVQRARGSVPAYAVTLEQQRRCAERGEDYIADLVTVGELPPVTP